jgi:hypothetical protein
MSLRLHCLTVLGTTPIALAQALPWDIPHRGAVVYERTTETFEVTPPPTRLRAEWVIAGTEDGGHEWRYYACPQSGVPSGFEQPGFDDAQWLLGRGEFGPDAGKNPQQRTPWLNQELCLRTRLDLGQRRPRIALFRIHHDDGIRVFVNGTQVVANDGYGRGRIYAVTGKQLDVFTRGENLVAVRCSQTGGAQYCDIALAVFHSLPPGLRNGEDLQKALAEETAAAGRVRGDLFGAFRPPALLLQGELTAAQDAVRLPPGDLRDVAWWLAMDLRQGTLGGATEVTLHRLYRLGDLAVRGKVSAVDADGWQTIEANVRNTPEPALGDDGKRFMERHVRPHILYGFDGRVQIRRRLELRAGKGRVAEWQAQTSGRLLRGKDWKEHAADFELRETCRYKETRDGQDAPFRAMVRTALQRGTQHLRGRIENLTDPLLRAQPEDATDSYATGRLAIGLLALLKGGLPKDDAVVEKGLAALRQRRLVDTYSLANAIMALEAYYAPANEFADLKQGVIDRPRRRTPAPADLTLLKNWTAQLLDNTDTRVDPAYLLRFNYTRGARFDNSVTQYGLLGLYSAHLCGVAIPAVTWEAAANHLIASQGDGRRKVELEVVDYRTFARLQADPDGRRTVVRSFVRAAGWNYEGPKDQGEETPRYGSMTCAGITGLAICQAALLDSPNLKRPKLQGDCNQARAAGFAWLAEQMTVRYHAGDIDRQQHWIYYYLYGLERAALLSGVALIQDRDWYFEGAMLLILLQQGDGAWPGELHWDQDIERNAMAILFLKQSTLPVLTGQ